MLRKGGRSTGSLKRSSQRWCPGDSGVLGPVKEDKALRRREESPVSTPTERPAKMRIEK